MNHVGEVRSTQQAPTVVVSERAAPDLRAENSAVSYGNGAVSIHSEGNYKTNRWVMFAANESVTHRFSSVACVQIIGHITKTHTHVWLQIQTSMKYKKQKETHFRHSVKHISYVSLFLIFS